MLKYNQRLLRAYAKLKLRKQQKKLGLKKKTLCIEKKGKKTQQQPIVHGKFKLQLEECQLVTACRKGENLPEYN